jgi:hypothetical protein
VIDSRERSGTTARERAHHAAPLIHAEIRSADPRPRAFFGELFGWTYADAGFPATRSSQVPGVTFGVLADAQGHVVGVAASSGG